MLAARLPSILPPLSPAELLEVSMIASVARNRRRGAYQPAPVPRAASFRLHAGAGRRRLARQAGRDSLAHNGVLSSTSFRNLRRRRSTLRQPLESGEVAIARANHRVTYPARFMLVAAMNPCRCGARQRSRLCLPARAGICAARRSIRRGCRGRCSTASTCTRVPAVTAADLIFAAALRREPRNRRARRARPRHQAER